VSVSDLTHSHQSRRQAEREASEARHQANKQRSKARNPTPQEVRDSTTCPECHAKPGRECTRRGHNLARVNAYLTARGMYPRGNRPTQQDVIDALDCPDCSEPRGLPCQSPHGQIRGKVHRVRMDAYRQATFDERPRGRRRRDVLDDLTAPRS
jgi:hypothetical protein